MTATQTYGDGVGPTWNPDRRHPRLPGGRAMSPLLWMLTVVVIGCAIAAVVLSAWGKW